MLKIKRGKSITNKHSAMYDFFQSKIFYSIYLEMSTGKLG
jgi:hypothetical protein